MVGTPPTVGTGPGSTPRPELLLLDAGGVIFEEKFDHWLGSLDRPAGLPAGTCARQFDLRWYRPLWSGTLSTGQFLSELAELARRDPQQLQDEIMAGFDALPTVTSNIKRWAGQVPVWVLSNHRAEWLRPLITRQGLDGYLARMFISSETGRIKPDGRAYEMVATAWAGPPGLVLFVDDRERNLVAARAAGFQTVLADPAGSWVAQVDRVLPPAC
jgi:putative hydrolase of the HAD superfamily